MGNKGIINFNGVYQELKHNQNNKMFIVGVDESYKNTGVSVTYGNPFSGYDTIFCDSIGINEYKDKNDYRVNVLDYLTRLLQDYSEEMRNSSICNLVVVERIRQFSKGFISMDYIKSMGALIAYIVEAANQHSMQTYSVDTRCWKSTVVGSSQKLINSYNVAPEKFQTVEYVVKHGMKEFIFEEISEKAGIKELKKKNPHNVFKSATGKYIHVDDDKADSICISRFPFVAMEQGKVLSDLLLLEQ